MALEAGDGNSETWENLSNMNNEEVFQASPQRGRSQKPCVNCNFAGGVMELLGKYSEFNKAHFVLRGSGLRCEQVLDAG